MYFSHYSHIPHNWMYPYPNFSFEGDPMLYCPLTKGFYFHEPTLSALQRLRFLVDRPIHINSGHRSPLHNARVRGEPRSAHLNLALDLRLPNGPDPEFYKLAKEAGFKSFGFYNSFLHCDLRPEQRKWYGSTAAKRIWQSLSDDL